MQMKYTQDNSNKKLSDLTASLYTSASNSAIHVEHPAVTRIQNQHSR